jgi:hypothetical protein
MLSPPTLDNCAVQVTLGYKMRAISVEPITFPAPDYLFVRRLEYQVLRKRRISGYALGEARRVKDRVFER